MAKVLIYGATGYTGKMLARLAAKEGMAFAVGGRNRVKVEALAGEVGVEAVVFDVNDTAAMKAALQDVTCIISAAGPFTETAEQVIDACIDTKTHYIDTTGELPVFELAHSSDEAAKKAGIMLMPGAGWDVVPSDCIGLYAAEKVKDVKTVRLAIVHKNAMPSRGTLRTGLSIVGRGVFVRRDGELVEAEEPMPTHEFDLGFKKVTGSLTPMGDLVTTYKSTGAPNIEVYSNSMGAITMPEGGVDAFPEGPSREQLDAWQAFAAAEATGADGSIARAVIETVSGYDFTAIAGIGIAQRIVDGNFKPGFQSPASAYGAELATELGGTITDIA